MKEASNVAAKAGISGRGPTRLMRPVSTNQHWGNSSRCEARRKLPHRVVVVVAMVYLSASAGVSIGSERSFTKLNGRPPRPRRFCTKRGHARKLTAEPTASNTIAGAVTMLNATPANRPKARFVGPLA